MSRRLDHVQAAAEEAHKLGANFDYEVKPRNIVGVISINGKQRKLFMSKTPSDNRAALNIQKNVRAYVREMRNEGYRTA